MDSADASFLRTLCSLRWLATAGQASAILVATGLLEALAAAARGDGHPLATLQPELDGLIARLRALRPAQ